MNNSNPLFDPSLISETVTSTLQSPFKIRPLERSDYAKGFLECLRVLTHIGDISEARFNERYDWMVNEAKGGYYVLVIEDDKQTIVGTGVLVVERKFIHDLGAIGHIEEISIMKQMQGKGLGLKMINVLDSVAQNIGCYKTILSCGEHNEAFYVKCGYKRSCIEMVHYYENNEGKTRYQCG